MIRSMGGWPCAPPLDTPVCVCLLNTFAERLFGLTVIYLYVIQYTRIEIM